jgi:uncharacterized protein (DUF1778 family)
MDEKNQGEKKVSAHVYYRSEEHRVLVREAAEAAGLSVNAWIVSVTLQAARKQLSR